MWKEPTPMWNFLTKNAGTDWPLTRIRTFSFMLLRLNEDRVLEDALWKVCLTTQKKNLVPPPTNSFLDAGFVWIIYDYLPSHEKLKMAYTWTRENGSVNISWVCGIGFSGHF